MLDFSGVKVLTFDCYGTLIDWEGGILSAFKPLLSSRRTALPDSSLLELYGRFEREAQAQTPFVNYRTVLKTIVKSLSGHLSLDVQSQDEDLLVDSMKEWLPFSDTVAALRGLKERFRLAILSNVDDDLFRLSQARLEVPFDWVITSEQLRSYKPSESNFRRTIATIGVDPVEHVHVAQSLFHDIAPASALGIKTVWVNRQGAAATPLIDALPDLEVPDLETLVGMLPPTPPTDS